MESLHPATSTTTLITSDLRIRRYHNKCLVSAGLFAGFRFFFSSPKPQSANSLTLHKCGWTCDGGIAHAHVANPAGDKGSRDRNRESHRSAPSRPNVDLPAAIEFSLRNSGRETTHHESFNVDHTPTRSPPGPDDCFDPVRGNRCELFVE